MKLLTILSLLFCIACDPSPPLHTDAATDVPDSGSPIGVPDPMARYVGTVALLEIAPVEYRTFSNRDGLSLSTVGHGQWRLSVSDKIFAPTDLEHFVRSVRLRFQVYDQNGPHVFKFQPVAYVPGVYDVTVFDPSQGLIDTGFFCDVLIVTPPVWRDSDG